MSLIPKIDKLRPPIEQTALLLRFCSDFVVFIFIYRIEISTYILVKVQQKPYLCGTFNILTVVRTDRFSINLKSLAEGKHEFQYCLDDNFFAQCEQEEISKGEVQVVVKLDYSNGLYRFNFAYDGYVVGQCHRCLSDLELDVFFERSLLVRFGEEFSEEEDELLILPHQDFIWGLDWTMCEDVLLSLPDQALHEDYDEDCDPEMMTYFNDMLVTEIPEEKAEVEHDEDGIDVRWAGLKNLKN